VCKLVSSGFYLNLTFHRQWSCYCCMPTTSGEHVS